MRSNFHPLLLIFREGYQLIAIKIYMTAPALHQVMIRIQGFNSFSLIFYYTKRAKHFIIDEEQIHVCHDKLFRFVRAAKAHTEERRFT